MGNVAERAAMHERRGAFECLHQIGLDRIAQQGGHRAMRPKISGSHRQALCGLADDDPAQSLLQLRQRLGQAQNRHHLRGHRDLKARLARIAVRPSAQPCHDVPQSAIIHIQAALVGNRPQVQPQGVPLVDMVIGHRRQQVVRRPDGVHIAGEVQVDILHRNHLRPAAARRPALHAEHRPHRRLAYGSDPFFAELAQALCQPDHDRCLSFTRRGGGDGGDDDQLAARRST